MTPIVGRRRSGTRHALAFLLPLALLFGAGCSDRSAPTSPSPPGTQTPAPIPAPTDSEVVSFVEQMNAHRVALGLQPLIWDGRVAAVAQAHSQDMVDRNFFSHTNPDGLLPWDRLDAAGIAYSAAGENIAYGYTTGTSVLNAWLGSTGHRANIENATFTHHGVGKAGTYWTHVFIRTTVTTAAATTGAR